MKSRCNHIAIAQSHARIGLLGNPSDLYNGKCLSASILNYTTFVIIYPNVDKSSTIWFPRSQNDDSVWSSRKRLVDMVDLNGYYGSTRLFKSAYVQFINYLKKKKRRIPAVGFSVQMKTSIPTMVGLAGSSAIVTAFLKALASFYEERISEYDLVLLSAEAERALGIRCGYQDRIAQIYNSLVFMDFSRNNPSETREFSCEKLDKKLLPMMYIAYANNTKKQCSGQKLTASKTLTADDPTIQNIAYLATAGREALLAGDKKSFSEYIDLNYNLRESILPVSETDSEIVRLARACGMSAKLTGSGGCITGVYTSEEQYDRFVVTMKTMNVSVEKVIFA